MDKLHNKAFIFDLDGTLLNSRKEISKRTLRLLQHLQHSGVPVIFATARPPRAVKSFLKDFDGPSGFVYLNGALYTTDRNISGSFSIERQLFSEILDFVELNDSSAIVSVEKDDSWFTHQNFNFKTFFGVEQGPEVLSRDSLTAMEPNKILVNKTGFAALLKDRFGDRCNILVTDGGELVQISSLEAAKEHAVAILLGELSKSFSDAVCFGDDTNDMGLFRKCGTAVAMGNAVPELKEIADFLALSNDEEGVVDFIERYFSLKFQ